jgi:hypothetical protein
MVIAMGFTSHFACILRLDPKCCQSPRREFALLAAQVWALASSDPIDPRHCQLPDIPAASLCWACYSPKAKVLL